MELIRHIQIFGARYGFPGDSLTLSLRSVAYSSHVEGTDGSAFVYEEAGLTGSSPVDSCRPHRSPVLSGGNESESSTSDTRTLAGARRRGAAERPAPGAGRRHGRPRGGSHLQDPAA